MDCSLHIAALVRELQSQIKKKQKGRIIIYLDLSNAYNCVKRDLVFKRLREREKFKGFFNEKELYALEWVYEPLHMYDPVQKKKIIFQNGVHQGSTLAPFLFDIYFDQLIDELQKEVRLKMLSRKLRKKNVEKDLFYKQLRWTKIFAYADDVAISTFGPQASWIIGKLWIQHKNLILKQMLQNLITQLIQRKQLEQIVLDTQGYQSLLKARLKIVEKWLRKKLNFCVINQQVYMTQLWNSFVKPHFDQEAPLMRHFSAAHLTIKKTLKLPQYLPNEELDKIWKQLGFRPSALLQYTEQQTIRFREELKRTKQPFSRIQLMYLIDDYWHKSFGLRIKQEQINSAYYQMKKEERLKSNLKIKYIPNKGYLERYKHSWKECVCGERWTFNHVKMHDPILKDDFENFENEIDSYLLSGTQIYQLNFIKIMCVNARLLKLVESHQKQCQRQSSLEF